MTLNYKTTPNGIKNLYRLSKIVIFYIFVLSKLYNYEKFSLLIP